MNAETGASLATDAQIAASFWEQFIGLIGKPALPAGQAVGILRCDWVHTFGVRFPIDVIYCDADGKVLKVVENLAPGSVAPRAAGARIAWEAEAGRFAGRVRAGQYLTLVSASQNAAEAEQGNV